MSENYVTDSQTCRAFFQPMVELLDQCRHRHGCPELPDQQWCQLGVGRVLLDPTTGRGFLQQYAPVFEGLPSTGLFFEALKSPRRLKLCSELNGLLCRSMGGILPDPLARFDEVKKFDIYAGDGHWHGAAAHDRRKEERKWAVGHFYTLDLRSHAMSHLGMADEIHRNHEHDMRALKRQSLEALRRNAPKGRKVLYAWDSASIDFEQWDQWKRGGVYFLSRAKENMSYEIERESDWDRRDGMNHGVLSDQLIRVAPGILLRLIRCQDPATGLIHRILTNERTIPPGLLAQIYRMRWDVEKVFDEFKNGLKEQKAWASSGTAKTMQAHFLCLTHNLMVLMEHYLKDQLEVINEAEEQRRFKRLKELKKIASKSGRRVSKMYDCLKRFAKRSLKMIRSLRTYLFKKAPLSEFASYLSGLYATL